MKFGGVLIFLTTMATVCVAQQDMNDIFNTWNSVVSRHVKQGGLINNISLNTVDYAGISQDPNFTKFIKAIETVDASKFDKNMVYAFYMNVYNALAIKMIIDHPCSSPCTPIKSIRDIGSLFHPVWTMTAGVVAGKKMSLNDVESYLRNPTPFKEDCRLHMSIVCASISCPNLRNEAFRPETVSDQMDSQVYDFIYHHPNKGFRFNSTTDTLTLSPIFEWFSGDFKKQYGSVLDYFIYILPDDIAHQINNNPPTMRYFDYDWNVNGVPPCKC